MKNPHASALGKLALGKRKTLTAAERERRRAWMVKVNQKRSIKLPKNWGKI